ncbi:MAG: hypothetical protein ACREQ5_08730, partial [Candidatus Dormibacteria bacterium]
MITYGDAFLLLQNDESSGTQLDEWLRKYLPIDQFVDQLEETAQMRSGRQAQSRAAAFDGGQVAMRGVAPLNYPPAPKMRLNTLWWPTGAARWGRFYGLIDGNSLEELTSSMPVPKPLALVINDPTNDTEIIAERMWMLQPRKLNPIEAVADTPYVDLWLLPLVDDRYYWQMIAYNLLINPIVTTWRDLFTLLVIGLR